MGDPIDIPKEYEKKLFEISEKNGHSMMKNLEQAIIILSFLGDKPTDKDKREYLRRIIAEMRKGKDSGFYEVFWNPHNYEL